MLKKFILSMVTILTGLFISACTANTDPSNNTEKTPTDKPVQAEILLPNKISLNQESKLKIQLTQGQEKVKDADKVQFEIWKRDHKNKSEMIDAQHEKNGIYSIKKTFHEDGVYYIQTHVTARDMHVMPVKQFVVGNVSEEELKKSNEKHPQKQEKDHDQNPHH